MEREEFFKLIENKGFKKVEGSSPYGDRFFETVLKSDGWMDGYNNKYFLTFQPTYGIKFTLDKFSFGGFTGNQEIKERLFSGVINTEDELNTVLKCVRFNEGIL